MKEKIDLGQFIDALVQAKGMVDKANRLETEMAHLTAKKDALSSDIQQLADDLNAAAASATKQKILIDLDVISAQKTADQSLADYQKAKDDEKKALDRRYAEALREAQQTLAMAQADAASAVAAATTAKVELAAIQDDLAAGRAAAERLSRFANVGKA